jgi:aminopeptidase-like protein
MANDNLTGLAVATVLAKALSAGRPRLSWRVVFGPGTIGSLAWLSRNEASLGRLTGGLVIGLLGDATPLTYKRSRRGDTATDRAMELVLGGRGSRGRIVPFAPYGYDERQFCSPGFDLPVGRLTRGSEASFPEYHTSADDLDFVRPEAIAESISVLAEAILTLDGNAVPQNLQPKGERRLGSRGLYSHVGGVSPRDVELAMLWVLNLGDGRHDLVEVARRSGFGFGVVADAAEALRAAGLIEFRKAAGTESRVGST